MLKVGDKFTYVSEKSTLEFFATHPEVKGYSLDEGIITILIVESEVNNV
jgi:hypothetical protein